MKFCQNFCKQNKINIEVYNQSYFTLGSYRKDMSKRGAKEQARGGKRLSSVKEESKDTPPHIVHKYIHIQTIPIFALIFVVPPCLHIHIR